MEKGFSVVMGMTLAYAVSFFGMMLAFIVYQRNNSSDDMWRRRPVGVSFFSACYGYIIPVLILANVFLTLGIKLIKGWEFNRFVWNDQALTWPIPAGIILFWLVGWLFWRMKPAGYAAAVVAAAAGTVAMIYLLAGAFSLQGGASLHHLGAYVTGLIWHLLWTVYLLRSEIRGLFLKGNEAPAARPPD